jgi:hypothetical protein
MSASVFSTIATNFREKSMPVALLGGWMMTAMMWPPSPKK